MDIDVVLGSASDRYSIPMELDLSAESIITNSALQMAEDILAKTSAGARIGRLRIFDLRKPGNQSLAVLFPTSQLVRLGGHFQVDGSVEIFPYSWDTGSGSGFQTGTGGAGFQSGSGGGFQSGSGGGIQTGSGGGFQTGSGSGFQSGSGGGIQTGSGGGIQSGSGGGIQTGSGGGIQSGSGGGIQTGSGGGGFQTGSGGGLQTGHLHGKGAKLAIPVPHAQHLSSLLHVPVHIHRF